MFFRLTLQNTVLSLVAIRLHPAVGLTDLANLRHLPRCISGETEELNVALVVELADLTHGILEGVLAIRCMHKEQMERLGTKTPAAVHETTSNVLGRVPVLQVLGCEWIGSGRQKLGVRREARACVFHLGEHLLFSATMLLKDVEELAGFLGGVYASCGGICGRVSANTSLLQRNMPHLACQWSCYQAPPSNHRSCHTCRRCLSGK